MKGMQLKGALIYEFQDSMKANGVFVAVLYLVGLINIILSAVLGNATGNFGGMEVSAWVYVLVVGIVSVRQDLRLFLQNGRGRPTVFLLQIFVCFLCAVVLALAAPVISAVLQLTSRLVAPHTQMQTAFEAIFLYEGRPITGWESMAFSFLACVPAYFFGMAISLIYYRLTKLAKVIFSIAAPGLLFVGLPLALANNPALSSAIRAAVVGFLNGFESLLGLFAVLALIGTAFFGLLSWLLLRRAPVQ